MNTAAVSQPPMAAAEAAADRSRNATREDGLESQEGDFSRLLSKLANNRGHEDSPTEPMRPEGGDTNRDGGGLHHTPEAVEENGRATDFGQQAIGQQDGKGGVFTDIDINALLQSMSTSGVFAGASGLSAIASRVANGTMTDAETALMRVALAAQQDGEALSPEQLILASLAKASDRETVAESPDAKPTVAALTVLRRETHFAPVADAVVQWAARFAGESNPMVRPSVQPHAEDAEKIKLLDSDSTAQGGDEEQLTNPRVLTATVTGDASFSTDWRRGALPMAELQAGGAAELQPHAAGQAPVVGRPDALVNAGLAPTFSQQIAERVIAEATAPAAQAARPNAPSFGVKHESPMKVMHIQLQPADLGVVTIRMSVKDNALRLDLEVGRGETASLIQRDREALSALLRAAGYVIDGMEVRIADPSSAGAQNGNGQANTPMQGGGQSSSSQPDGRSPGERPQNERGSNPFGDRRNRGDEQAGTATRGGVYI